MDANITYCMKNRSSFAILKGKARNGAHVSAWLETISEGRTDTVLRAQRHTMIKGFNMYWELNANTKPRITMTDAEAATLEDIRKMMLLCYHSVSKSAKSSGRSFFRMRPKFHRIDHACRRAIRTKLFPWLFWTFGSEDMMGVIARLSRVVHGSATCKGTVSRWLIAFWSDLMSE